MTYTADMLIRIAKRSNNTKRRYLVVNPLQGKHLPVHPINALAMMQALGSMVKEAHPHEKILCIGFAETATAIGAVVAGCCNGNYIHTTREEVGSDYFSFSEEHSHAAEQKLCRDNWEHLSKGIERIVFVEDEVSTGKTLRALVTLLKKSGAVPATMHFSAASLINLMGAEDLRLLAEAGIEPLFLVKADNADFDAQADRLVSDDSLLIDARADSLATPAIIDRLLPRKRDPVGIVRVNSKRDPRTGVSTAEYTALNQKLGEEICRACPDKGKLLVLGTEECMFPALSVAAVFERAYPNLSVYSHATTRTPIAPSPASPITKGYRLCSVYDTSRISYLYNVGAYDMAFLITDSSLAASDLQAPLNDVRTALAHAGTRNFLALHWV